MLLLRFFCFLLLTYWASLIFGASIELKKRDLECTTALPVQIPDARPCKKANTDDHLQPESIHMRFNSLFLKKFIKETGIEANSIDWDLLRGCLPEGFVIPTGDWSLDDIWVLMCCYHRVRFFIPLDEELGHHFESKCARLREPLPLKVPRSSTIPKFDFDEEGHEFARAFDLTCYEGENTSFEKSLPVCNVESSLIPESTLASTLKDLQELLASILLDKCKHETKLPRMSLPWALCSIVGLPASIDFTDAEHVRWIIRNIYRFRFFSPHQRWRRNMFARDLVKLPPLGSHEPYDHDGLQLENHYDFLLYKITYPSCSDIRKSATFKISDTVQGNAAKMETIRKVVNTLHLKLLKDLGVNAESHYAIIIGTPFSIPLSTWTNWTDAQFQTFLSHYSRIRAFSLNQTKLAEEYAEQVQALPPPPLVEKFTIANGELITGPNPDTEGLRLRQKWNSPSAAGTSSKADDANAKCDATALFANALVRDSQYRSELCQVFHSAFLKKFIRETRQSMSTIRISWNEQLHAGYPINLHVGDLIYLTESGMQLFLRHFHRIRFFRNDQKELHAEYIERLADLPEPPQTGAHYDTFGIALQAEFDQRTSISPK